MPSASGAQPLIGMVLVTHGHLADEFVVVLGRLVGPQDRIETVCIGPDDDMEDRRTEILAKVGAVDSGKGVVLLTDMFGGTPSNLAISIMEKANVEVIAGINLAMLTHLAALRAGAKLTQAVAGAQDAGVRSIASTVPGAAPADGPPANPAPVILASRGRLGEEFLAALQHVVGDQTAMSTVTVDGGDGDADRVLAALDSAAGGRGAAILVTDAPDSLDSALLGRLAASRPVEILSGMNLPMLIKLAQARAGEPPSAAVAQARDAGMKYINVASTLLRETP